MRASHKQLNDNTPLAALMRRAHRRRLFQLLTGEGALACAIALGGGIVLLVLGTEILAWYWLALLFAAGLGLGGYRLRKNLESRYQVACTLDRNLALKDALSTALYFSEHPERTNNAPVVEQQREMAQDVARTADLKRGLPYTVGRSAYVSALLALIAGGLCALRYGVTGTMDLHRSLVQIAHNSFSDPTNKRADARKKPGDPRAKDWANPAGLKYDPWEAQPLDQTGSPEQSLATIDTPDVDNSHNSGPSDPQAKGNPSKENPESSNDPEGGERSSGSNDQSPDGSSAPDKEGGKSGAPQQGADQKGQNPGESSSLSDKMKDALSNLLSKFKSQPKGSNGKQSGSQNQPGTQQQNGQNRQSNPNGSPTPGRPQDNAMANPDGQGGQDSQGTEQAKSGQGKSNGKSDDKSNSQEGKSGIGRQDGDKSVKEAAQLATMGKISEIIGKRAQNVSGEVMVEVASGNQQLKTQYSQKKAAHGDTGGEIGRDEVPLAYQQFVQQYFEEIRKTPPSGAKTKKPADAAKKGTGT